MKPAIMELGGHGPVIVCDDADPVATAKASAVAKSRNAGQVCVAPTRFFVQEENYESFARSFAEVAAKREREPFSSRSAQHGCAGNVSGAGVAVDLGIEINVHNVVTARGVGMQPSPALPIGQQMEAAAHVERPRSKKGSASG